MGAYWHFTLSFPHHITGSAEGRKWSEFDGQQSGKRSKVGIFMSVLWLASSGLGAGKGPLSWSLFGSCTLWLRESSFLSLGTGSKSHLTLSLALFLNALQSSVKTILCIGCIPDSSISGAPLKSVAHCLFSGLPFHFLKKSAWSFIYFIFLLHLTI